MPNRLDEKRRHLQALDKLAPQFYCSSRRCLTRELLTLVDNSRRENKALKLIPLLTPPGLGGNNACLDLVITEIIRGKTCGTHPIGAGRQSGLDSGIG